MVDVEARMRIQFDRGLLVPFLGAGMSAWPADATTQDVRNRRPDDGRRGLPLWDEFVDRLDPGGMTRRPPWSDPTERAAAAVRRLRHVSQHEFVDHVRQALGDAPVSPPPQLAALARAHWPLVLTTNYDDLYVAATHEARPGRPSSGPEVVPLELLGRSERDCQTVLASLRAPARPLLWALQGFVGGQAQIPAPLRRRNRGASRYRDVVMGDPHYREQAERLVADLVVGHAEYRRVALRSEHFRRTFAEVFRSRSFVFLGSSLTDRYFLDLFSEVVELYGPCPHPHFAYLKEGQANPAFLRQYYGIWVIELPTYAALAHQLDRLTARPDSRPLPLHSLERASIAQGSLPHRVPDGECIVVSAGGTSTRRLHLSNVGKDILSARGLTATTDDFEPLPSGNSLPIPVVRHRTARDVYAVVARLDPWSTKGAALRPLDPTLRPIGTRPHPTMNAATMRDFRLVAQATNQLLNAARNEGITHVHSMLLAAGGRRTFPQSLALLQMIRAWSRSNALPETPALTVYLHESAEEVLVDLRSGRLDPRDGLDPEHVTFWIEVDLPPAPYVRHLTLERADASLLAVAEDLDITDDDWELDIGPRPTTGFANWTLAGVKKWEEWSTQPMTLERIGILTGSILRFSKN